MIPGIHRDGAERDSKKEDAMKEFVMLFRTRRSALKSLSTEEFQRLTLKLHLFIESMMSEGKMRIAQPLEMDGFCLRHSGKHLGQARLDLDAEMISDWYLIQAKDLMEAISIVASDPRLDCGLWTVEGRQVLSETASCAGRRTRP